MIGGLKIFLFSYLDLKIMGQSIYIISVLKKPIKKLFLIERGSYVPLFSFPTPSPPLSSILEVCTHRPFYAEDKTDNSELNNMHFTLLGSAVTMF